jgi:hypothetical protein
MATITFVWNSFDGRARTISDSLWDKILVRKSPQCSHPNCLWAFEAGNTYWGTLISSSECEKSISESKFLFSLFKMTRSELSRERRIFVSYKIGPFSEALFENVDSSTRDVLNVDQLAPVGSLIMSARFSAFRWDPFDHGTKVPPRYRMQLCIRSDRLFFFWQNLFCWGNASREFSAISLSSNAMPPISPETKILSLILLANLLSLLWHSWRSDQTCKNEYTPGTPVFASNAVRPSERDKTRSRKCMFL